MPAAIAISLLLIAQAAAAPASATAPAVQAAPAQPAPASSAAAKPVGDTYALAMSDTNRALLVNLTTFKGRGATKTFTVLQIYPGAKSRDQNQTSFDYEVVSQVIKCGVETQTVLKQVQYSLPNGVEVSRSPVSEFGDPIQPDTYPFKLMQFVCGEKLTDKTRQLNSATELDLAKRIRAAYPNLIGY